MTYKFKKVLSYIIARFDLCYMVIWPFQILMWIIRKRVKHPAYQFLLLFLYITNIKLDQFCYWNNEPEQKKRDFLFTKWHFEWTLQF